MSLSERFSGQAFNLADVEAFVERAKVLGHGPKTMVGPPGVGLKLYIDTNRVFDHYQCSEFNRECKAQFEGLDMARSLGSSDIICPPHNNSRGFNCAGAGKPGIGVS